MLSAKGTLLVVLDGEGHIVRFNRACEELTGSSFQEVEGKYLWNLFPIPEGIDSMKRFFAESRSGQCPDEYESHWVTRDGSHHLITWSYSALFSRDGKVEYVLCTGSDLTERKQVETELIRARDEWVRTFDAVPDLIMILDTEHRIVRANKAMADKLGCSPEELVGLNCHKVVHDTEEPPEFCPHALLLRSGTGRSVEVYEGRLKGDFLVSVSPLYDQEGRLTGSVHVARNISERKRAEEALKKAHDELEQRVLERTAEWAAANQKLEQEIEERKRVEEALRESETRLRHLSSQLLAIQEKERKRVAQELHDGIGQMLTAIKFKLETTPQNTRRGKAKDKEKSVDAIVPMIQQSIEEVRRIQMDLRPSILDDLGILATIGWFCREFQAVYSAIHIEKKVAIQEHEVSTPLKTVIYRVIQEALNNAAKHSQASLIRLSLRKADGKVELVIKDNGVGFLLEDVLSTESSKRGFGLSGMKERVELSGGAFSIESHKGAGTAVQALWPAT